MDPIYNSDVAETCVVILSDGARAFLSHLPKKKEPYTSSSRTTCKHLLRKNRSGLLAAIKGKSISYQRGQESILLQ